mmetsp:Transcript_27074/g.23965  ORF Transcript_27074/g.23965 Transcript_27074/m.23965 type:complete len:163 (+) Transcript_27074:619-1107(+)
MVASSNHCDTVFSIFLYSLSRKVNENFYAIMGILLKNLRECLNDHAYDIILDFFKKNYPEENLVLVPKKKENRYFTEEESPEYIPLVCDKFILEYLPKHCPDFSQQLAVDLMYDFSEWLRKKKLTKVKMQFNDDSQKKEEMIGEENQDGLGKTNVDTSYVFG